MKRLINFRAFLFVFIGAIFGVIFSYFIIQKNVVAFVVASIIALGLILTIVLTKIVKRNKKFEFTNKFLICLFIGFLLFLSLGVLDYKIFNNNLHDITNADVTARISYISEKDEYCYLILEDVVIHDSLLDYSKNINGKVSLIVYSINDFNIGDKIFFNGTLISTKLIKQNQFNSYLYKNNIKYSSFISESQYSKIEGNKKLDENVREKVKDLLFANMSYTNASIAYASIFGDKTMLETKIYDSFSVSGVAHLLCVSGLHVGFLVALLYFFFKLIKLKKKYIFIILIVLLGLYCYFCGFSPSVVRATIMSIVLAGSVCFGNFRYDNLSSLSFAGLIILLFKPFMVYDVGFQLSFASCFGIFLLMPVFIKLFKKINFYNKFTSIFSLTLSAQIATFPILLHNFEKLSFLSLVANIIIVPFFSIVFMLLIIFVLINLLFPLQFLFKVIELSFNLIVTLTKSIGSVSELVYYTFNTKRIINIVFYTAIILVSGFINIKTISKVTSLILSIIFISLAFLMQYFPQNYSYSAIINSKCDSFTILTNSFNQKILVITDEFLTDDLSLLRQDLLNARIVKLDAVVLSSYSSSLQNGVCKICNNYKADTLYLVGLNNIEEKYLFENLVSTKIYKTEDEYFTLNNFTFKIIKEIKSVEVNLIESSFMYTLFLTNNVNSQVSTYLIKYNISGDYLKAKYINKNYLTQINSFNTILCKNSSLYLANMYNISKINDTIVLKEGISYAI